MPDAFLIDRIECKIEYPGLWLYLRHLDKHNNVGRKYIYIISLMQDLHVIPASEAMFVQQPYVFRSSLVENNIKRANMMQEEALEKGIIVNYKVVVDSPTKERVYLQIHDVETQTYCYNRIAPFFVAAQHCIPAREPPLFS